MSLAVACLMPLIMMALVFFLARIEERHLTARPVMMVVPATPESEPPVVTDVS
jgi:hypothetical protein